MARANDYFHLMSVFENVCQQAAENILKEAWNKEGSPFLGTEYDPSLINFGNSSLELPEGHAGPS
jgi:hypothetical protein